MDILHIEQLLNYWRHSFCGLELYERSDWTATAPDMHHSHSLIQHHVHTTSISRQIGAPATLLHSSQLHCYPGQFFLC